MKRPSRKPGGKPVSACEASRKAPGASGKPSGTAKRRQGSDWVILSCRHALGGSVRPGQLVTHLGTFCLDHRE